MKIWYKNLIEQSQNRIAIKREDNAWLVRDTCQLIVLERHKNMIPLVLKQNQVATPSTTIGYYIPSTAENMSNWIPLLPGYIVYAKVSNICIKLSIVLDENYALQFEWIVYENDTFQISINSGTDYSLFKSLFSHYKLKNTGMSWLLGFMNIDNSNYLRANVHYIFPNLKEIDQILQHKQPNIQHNVILEHDSKNLSTKEIQALIVKYNELVAHKYNQNRKISNLQQQIELFQNQYGQKINSEKKDHGGGTIADILKLIDEICTDADFKLLLITMPVLPPCNICDNCKRRIEEKPKEVDASEEKRGYEKLMEERTSQKPKILKNKELITLALSDLIVKELVRQEIIIRRPNPTATYLTCTVIVHGIT
ncbi:18518_t:CDS:2 [Gigaspora rosea]|nr:18518_t:CDS:2 [Gigaspora rosea]